MRPRRSALRSTLSTRDGKSRYVRWLFSAIADRYDLITVVLSYGQDRRWKKRLVDRADLAAGSRVLDAAAGTGDIAFECARRGARVVGLDITRRMVELARQKSPTDASGPRFLVGDMMAMPFRDASFDVVTTGYGLRNVPEIAVAVRELARVLRPGGQLLSLDFDKPRNRVLRVIYFSYLTLVGSLLGLVMHRDPDTYRYIPESLRNYPGAEGVARLMRDQGFAEARFEPVLGGLMAVHVARR
ncbi:MAG: ubiquinone/menaquinone biosynthesis methyltransferase [Acidobacteria bacterium]|nr:ubiquinone/menaquinone biosynthesis methyltransferase [Acidobacteriota bacterium]MBI3263497.1 ubiquinone/menaquinone biosynthesis methyltransferase [Acidobacteriota bacterium]